jgi:hypothetical protein
MKIPTDLKDVKAIREFLTNIRTQVCGMADFLSEPWKTHFNDLKKHYDDAIAALPPTDAVPAALEANHHLACFYSCLANANALANMLGSALDSMIRKNAETVTTALNSAVGGEIEKLVTAGTMFRKETVDGKITEAIGARVKAGELVEKETHTQLCTAAKDLGFKEGEKKVRDEITAKEARKSLINTRRASLQTCGLPVPDEKLEEALAGTEEQFKAAQTTAENRIAALQKKGVALNSKSPLLAKVWLPQEQWEVFESLAVETLRGGDPLVAPAVNPNNGVPKIMVC